MTTPDVVLEAGQVWTNGVTTVTIQAIQVEICRTPRAYYAVRVLSEKRTSGVFVNDSGDLFDLARGIVRDGLQLADSHNRRRHMATVTADMVQEWRRLAEAATPGEWEMRHPPRRGTYKVRHTDDDGLHWYIAQDVPFGENAAFIAAARAAVPALCDALEAAWRERDALAAELAAVKAVPVIDLHDLSIDELIAAGDAISRAKVERYRRGVAAVDENGRYVP